LASPLVRIYSPRNWPLEPGHRSASGTRSFHSPMPCPSAFQSPCVQQCVWQPLFQVSSRLRGRLSIFQFVPQKFYAASLPTIVRVNAYKFCAICAHHVARGWFGHDPSSLFRSLLPVCFQHYPNVETVLIFQLCVCAFVSQTELLDNEFSISWKPCLFSNWPFVVRS
jgi:hypothetical protein